MNDTQIAILRAAFDEFGVTDPNVRAGIAAICMGESGMNLQTEMGYSHTSLARIRALFGSRVASLSNADLNVLKASDMDFFNHVYGPPWGVALGNTEPNDGYNYRGRGLNQLTGRANYQRYGDLLGVDLTNNPDQANDLTTAARIAVRYMVDRCPPGATWEMMKRAVGNAVVSTEAVKDAAYQRFLAAGTFA